MLAGRVLCLGLGDRFRITVIRILDEFFVFPASSTVAPPYHSPNEPTGNRSSRHGYPPELPSIRTTPVAHLSGRQNQFRCC
jgi:hypothetical protein